jgi:pimeloyl-ACP methyl ester carboxylesterase
MVDQSTPQMSVPRVIHSNRHPFPGIPIALIVLTCAIIAAGCATPIGVAKVGSEEGYKQINNNILTGKTVSVATSDVLRRFSLAQQYEDSPESVLPGLIEQACRDNRRDTLFAVSELSYAEGVRTKEKAFYIQSSIYAYLFLFEEGLENPPDPYDRRFRVAADLYNRGLAQGLSLKDGAEVDLASRSVPVSVGRVSITEDRSMFPWGEERFPKFLSADEFRVRGLERHRDPGLGLPLIALPSAVPTGKFAEGKLLQTLKIPATAFLRVSGDRCDAARGELSATLELYSAYDTTAVKVGDRTVPLEVDLTTPLAFNLERSRIYAFEYSGFLGRENNLKAGIFFVQPYEAGKTPVVFVHGTASSPARWAPMLNGLLADPVIRRRFQFWMFIYETGNPIVYSASLLRDSLKRVVRTLDPLGENPSLNRMVLIGHSQGGLLAKMMVIDPGDRLWSNMTDKKIDDIKMPEDTRTLLRKAFFFEPLPFVQRVVFIATPQRGSFVSKSWIGRFFSRLVSLPKNIVQMPKSVVQALTTKLPPEVERKIPTSVDNMSPDNPFIKRLAEIPIVPGVKVNSIIAVKGNGPVEEGNDGVVEYRSAHLEGAESEFVVRSGHSVQGNPLVIEEVRRILLEHVAPKSLGVSSSEQMVH